MPGSAKKRLRLLPQCVVFLAFAPAVAQEVAHFPIVDAPPKTPGLGPAFRTGHNIYIGENSRTDLIPLYLYEGDYIFAHGTSIGVHAFRNDTFTFDLLARYRFDRLDPSGNEELAGMSKRHASVDAGAAVGIKGRLGQLQLTGVADVLGNSNGSEVDLTYRYPLRRGNWGFSPFFSLIWQDADLTRYYFGVRPDEATPDRPAYEPDEALIVAYGVNTSYHLTDKFFVFGNIAFEGLDSAIANSPIVRSNNNAYALIGATYLFGDQQRFTPDSPPPPPDPNRPSWTWRVHYGYQIRENIFPLPMAGVWIRSDRTPDLTPTQAGLTLSKLVQRSERTDFFARVSFYRHFEEPFQDDFWSYNAFMSAMFKVYSPWSDSIALRWGFSFGVSYAESIPAEEIAKFENLGKNSSHLLNYLEWQVDFPLDKIIRSEATRNCFIGAVVTHRSGIFGTSDLLGNVAGGSDWAGLSVECML